MSVLGNYYTIEKVWKGSIYCGIHLKWNHREKYFDISMPDYVREKIIKYKHKPTNRHRHCPYEPNLVIHGKKSDTIIHEIDSPLLDKDKKKHVQQALCRSLYYMHTVYFPTHLLHDCIRKGKPYRGYTETSIPTAALHTHESNSSHLFLRI